MATCTWDSGSATGNRPLCDERATVVVTRSCYGGPVDVLHCARHAALVAARIYPDRVISTRPA